MTHRLNSIGHDLSARIDAVPPSRAHSAGLRFVVDALDRNMIAQTPYVLEILADERELPGSRRSALPVLGQLAAQFDENGFNARDDGDSAAYVANFQAARVVLALRFLIAGGTGALRDVAYEAAMAVGTESVVSDALIGLADA